MDIIYSDHAKKRMKQRGIEEWEIEHALKFPSYTKKLMDGKIEVLTNLRNREIKVIFIRKESYIKIVTVI